MTVGETNLAYFLGMFRVRHESFRQEIIEAVKTPHTAARANIFGHKEHSDSTVLLPIRSMKVNNYTLL